MLLRAAAELARVDRDELALRVAEDVRDRLERIDRLRPRDHPLEWLGSGDARRKIGDQHLARDQLRDVSADVLDGQLWMLVREQLDDLAAARTGRAPRDHEAEIVGRRHRDEAVRAVPLRVGLVLEVAKLIRDAIEARVGAERHRVAQLRQAQQIVRERTEVAHVEPRVAAIAARALERQLGRLADGADRAAREQPERGRAAAHPREVAHEPALDLGGALALGLADPDVDLAREARRRDEDRFADLRSLDDRPQARAQDVDVGRVVAPAQELTKRQQRRPHAEEASVPEFW